MVSVPTSLGEWIHSPWLTWDSWCGKGYRPRVRLVLAGGHASAWISPFWRGPAPGAQRYQADPREKECRQPEAQPSSPIAPAQKRARSVDTGQATQQQPGPPIKLPKSRSVENLAISGVRSPPPDHTGNIEEEVDFGGSEPSSPRPTEREAEQSSNSSPTAQSCPGSPDHRATPEAQKPVANKGVILVSEAFTEINAGLVIVLASGHGRPILETDLIDPERDPDELATIASTAYRSHVESYLSTTQPPCDTETAVSSGLLGSPLLGTATRCAADSCHAWSILGQWSGLVTFPVPATGQWPRHGHLRGILDGFQGRQPNFHKWARPAYEQGALPTLSLLPGEVVIKVLPGDKIYQAMEIEPGFMRPAILHGFGTRAKQRLPSRLKELAQFGWLPLAAALFGTAEWQPQWLHQNFLPVIGLRVHAKIPPSPLSYQQQVALLGLWERSPAIGTQCRALVQAADLTFGLPTVFRAPEDWTIEMKGEVFDLVQCSQRIYTGDAANILQAVQAPFDRPKKWARWILSLNSLWQEDSPMPDRPLTVHCSGLGGGLLSPDHEYDIFFQNHAQMKVYGPSLAMTDDWEQRITQLGLTKTTHEYAIYQLFSTALGWSKRGRNFCRINLPIESF